MKIKLFFVFLVGLFTLVGLSDREKPTVFLIGDSTVRTGNGDGANGQWGWGSALPLYFDSDKVNVRNHARGGTSSRTFYTMPSDVPIPSRVAPITSTRQSCWKDVLDKLQPGDYVLIQFGHNDGGATNDTLRARATLRGIGEEIEEIDNMLTGKHEVVHTFGWYMRQYIREVKAKGAFPIVCSLIPRNGWTSDNKMSSQPAYVEYSRQVAEEEGAPFIDLNARSVAALEAMGKSVVAEAAMYSRDGTHTLAAGAMLNAGCVVEGIRALQPRSTLDQYLLDKPSGAFPIKNNSSSAVIPPLTAVAGESLLITFDAGGAAQSLRSL